MARVTDLALCLRRVPYGESSLVVQVFTRARGRVHLIAKGAYRPTSGYQGVLDLFDTLELCWSSRAQGELHSLSAGRVVTRRAAIAGDLERYRAALACLELADLAVRPGQREIGLFDALERALDALRTPAVPADLALVAFELAFLDELGLAPALAACAACGNAAPPVDPRRRRVAFSAGAGGRLCAPHAAEARASGRRVGTLPLAVVERAARIAAAGPTAVATEISAESSGPALVRVRDLVERFLAYHLETPPKSQRAFLAAPNRNAPERDAAPTEP